MDDDEKDLFEVLGWGTKIVRLVNPHVPFNLSFERGVNGTKKVYDDYKMTLFCSPYMEVEGGG